MNNFTRDLRIFSIFFLSGGKLTDDLIQMINKKMFSRIQLIIVATPPDACLLLQK